MGESGERLWDSSPAALIAYQRDFPMIEGKATALLKRLWIITAGRLIVA